MSLNDKTVLLNLLQLQSPTKIADGIKDFTMEGMGMAFSHTGIFIEH